MKSRSGALMIFAICSAILFSTLANAQSGSEDARAANLQNSCAHWAKLHLDEHNQLKGETNDLYQTGVCVGFFQGLIDGIDNTGGWKLPDGNEIYTFHINRPAIHSTWDVIRSFYAYVDANPSAKEKPAWKVLQVVLVSKGLASFRPSAAQSQLQPSRLSKECSVGARNVLAQFDADKDLKIVDTATLASTLTKLADCSSTNGLSDSDKALIATAEAEVESELIVRATAVLERHSLLQELRSEHQVACIDEN